MGNDRHPWKFFRAGGLDQIHFASGADIERLAKLDRKLWVALACPVRGLECYGFNAQGQPDALLTPHPTIEALGRSEDERLSAYRQLFLHVLDAGLIAEIRTATRGGHVLGTEPFKREMALKLGRRVVPLQRGPKLRSLEPVPK